VNWPDLIESALRLLAEHRQQVFFSFDDIIAFIDEHWLRLWNPNIENLEGHMTKGWQQVIAAVLKVKQDIFEPGKEDGCWAVRPAAPLNSVGVALSTLVNSKRKLDVIDRECRSGLKKAKHELVELSALALASLEELKKQDSDEDNSSNKSPNAQGAVGERGGMERDQPHNFLNDMHIVRPQLTSNADAPNAEPVEVRSGRFVGVTLKDISCDRKRLFIAWTPCNNGLPNSCRLLVPCVGNYFSLSFKTKGRGWVELTCKKAVDPFYEVDFEMRIDPVLEGDSSHRKGDATTIQFVLVDKEGTSLKRLGEAYLDVIVRSTKNHNKSLLGRIVYDHETDRPVPSRNLTLAKDPMQTDNTAVDLVPYYQRHSAEQQAHMRMGLSNIQGSFGILPSSYAHSNQSVLPPITSAFDQNPQHQYYQRTAAQSAGRNLVSISNLTNSDRTYRDSRTQISNLIQPNYDRSSVHNSDFPLFAPF